MKRAGARWVVVDCETSGLDATRDRLLSVGAVAVRDQRIDPADSYSALLVQQEPSEPQNILIHGIGGDAQLAGRPAAEALGEFTRYLAGDVAVAFHAPFDAAVLRREMSRAGLKAPPQWLDLARLAPALEPALGRRLGNLDDWLRACGIAPHARHDALGDAFATAQLFLVLLAKARQQGADDQKGLLKLARDSRWLGI